MSQNSASELPLETREVPRRPTVAIWLSSFGGIALLLGALAFTSSGGGYGAWIPFLLLPFLGLAYVSSFLVLVGAFMVNVRPEAHTVWGLIILEAGILGIGPGNFFGALMIGTILSIAGGLSAIAFRPTVRKVQVRPEFTPESFLKKCVSCGKEIPIATETCSYCGKPQKGTS